MQLANGITFCLVGDEPVFLDEVGDRYFQLPPRLTDAFRSVLGREKLTTAEEEGLLALSCFQSDGSEGLGLFPFQIPMPPRSALEEDGEQDRFGVLATAEVGALLLRWNRRVRKLGLAGCFNIVRRWKQGSRPIEHFNSSRITMLARRFESARRLVPIAPRCLPDSLALLDFLSRRFVAGSLVVGVRLHPFRAHCWIQAGDITLNESLDGIAAYTPIRMI